jgi:glycosyltransferase involved in cell wall biosynthesis
VTATGVIVPTQTGRVLLVLGSVVRDRLSGGDAFVLNVAKRWAAWGVPVTVFTTSEGLDRVREVGVSGAEICKVASGPARYSISLGYLVRSLALAWACFRATRRYGPGTVVVSATPFAPDALGALAARVAGASWVLCWRLEIPPPWIRYEHVNDPTPRARLPRLGQALSYASQSVCLRLFKRTGLLLIVANEAMRARAEARGIPLSRVQVGRLGVDVREVTASLDEPEAEAFDAVFLGRFHPQKGLDDLPEIWRRVKSRMPTARLAIVGGGNPVIERRLRSALAQIPEAGASFVGVLEGEQKYRVLSKAKVLLFPSYYESVGHVVLEAMACRLPVIGYDIPSSRQHFGDAIVLVPIGAPARLADALLELLSDEGLRQAYVRRGLDVARRCDWEGVARGVLEALGTASLESKGGRQGDK